MLEWVELLPVEVSSVHVVEVDSSGFGGTLVVDGFGGTLLDSVVGFGGGTLEDSVELEWP